MIGGGLYINNGGSDAGSGLPGAQGAPGVGGPPGVSRTATQQRVCNSPVGWLVGGPICNLVPTGCGGGHDGGQGGQGSQGYPGYSGPSGGQGGSVSLFVPPDAQRMRLSRSRSIPDSTIFLEAAAVAYVAARAARAEQAAPEGPVVQAVSVLQVRPTAAEPMPAHTGRPGLLVRRALPGHLARPAFCVEGSAI